MKRIFLTLAAVVALLALAFVPLRRSRTELSQHKDTVLECRQELDKALSDRMRLLDGGGIGGPDVARAHRQALDAHTLPELLTANARLDAAVARLAPGEHMLHQELIAAHDRIAGAREKYNAALQRYNTMIVLFPNNIAARLFGFKREDAYYPSPSGPSQESLSSPVPQR